MAPRHNDPSLYLRGTPFMGLAWRSAPDSLAPRPPQRSNSAAPPTDGQSDIHPLRYPDVTLMKPFNKFRVSDEILLTEDMPTGKDRNATVQSLPRLVRLVASMFLSDGISAKLSHILSEPTAVEVALAA
ncbi:hypothetical protein SKAU_G00309690 [Synaphobranchus kaupii]|uniref:Uncharacterized protein n=1 Tax=Synaphobranchus kaupii TaxID=118154 RepID=A0A9Q1ERF1_SYNKA|nr:hypothetical protein SKAU_G00309690 [Synaphobranchus kaupii]